MIWKNVTGERVCGCRNSVHQPKLVVVTGGPGAGKTAVLESAKREFCEHVIVLPESAGIVFGGGFWRLSSHAGKKAAQRAIFYVQRETESIVLSEKQWAIGICDRGSLDGLAYWPSEEFSFWKELGTTLKSEYDRYCAVVHLRTPSATMGYNRQNILRVESVDEAQEIDRKIEKIWREHPRYMSIPSSANFLEKAKNGLERIRMEIPRCCWS